MPVKPAFPTSPIYAILANELASGILETRVDKLLDNVRFAPDGQKHYTRCKIAYVFGGYVSGGYYVKSDAISWLGEAIHPRAANKHKASRTIRDCLTTGKELPLIFEDYTKWPTLSSYEYRTASHPGVADAALNASSLAQTSANLNGRCSDE